jgi:hypothetical protein
MTNYIVCKCCEHGDVVEPIVNSGISPFDMFGIIIGIVFLMIGLLARWMLK